LIFTKGRVVKLDRGSSVSSEKMRVGDYSLGFRFVPIIPFDKTIKLPANQQFIEVMKFRSKAKCRPTIID
jgi:hypothetical protein